MKPLCSRFDLTEKGGALVRAMGWWVDLIRKPCEDCCRYTTWRDEYGIPRHPYSCG